MKSLFERLPIGTMTCKNRILRSATWEALADADGHICREQYNIYKTLAENNVGLICTGYARICREEQPNAGMLAIYDDCFIPEYRMLTDMVHDSGSRIMMQLVYGGTKTTFRTEERKIFAPSDIPEKSTGTRGVPMSHKDIRYLTDCYAQAACRAKESGFDAVQLHMGHSYLLNQFLSPYYNNRTDCYGGSLENRMRIICEIYEAIRQHVGEDYPLLVKITCSDFLSGGLVFEEVRRICRRIESLGFQAIEISGNIHGKANHLTDQYYDGYPIVKDGYFLEYAKIVAEEVSIPVYVTGGFKDPVQMTAWLKSSALAGFGLSRPFLAEPHLIRRWEEGDLSPSICLHCSRCRTPEGNYCTLLKASSS